MAYSFQPPRHDMNEYHCPHCGVFANFTTFPLFYQSLPSSSDGGQAQSQQGKRPELSSSEYRRLTQNVSNEPSTFDGSRCAECEGVLIWNGDIPYYPAPTLSNEAMDPLLAVGDVLPDGVLDTIRTAVSISALAPTAAAALLRRALLCLSEALGYTPAASESMPTGAYVEYLDGVFKTDEMTILLTESCRRAGATLRPGVIYETDHYRVIQPLIRIIVACAAKVATSDVSNAQANAQVKADARLDQKPGE